MSQDQEVSLKPFDRKILETLKEKAVHKSLAAQASFHGLPRFVTEYLLAKFVKPDTWKEDVAKVQARIREMLPNPENRELTKEKLLSTGEVTLIDQVECRVDLVQGKRWAKIPSLELGQVVVRQALLEENPGLLLGGLWGTFKVKYHPDIDPASPNEIVSFTPFQVGPPDMAEYRSFRGQFRSDEWLDLMLQSSGYEPAAFTSRRIKFLVLSRLIPLVERNVNLIELGPRQTGKTYLLRNISPRVFTISGGKATPANLFVNLSTGAIGILGNRKVVVFDEIAHTSFDSGDGTISILKDFMESGQFTRGNKQFGSDCGIYMAGNIDVEEDKPHPRYRHLFEPLPAALIDSAFQDRIHGFVPGWEIPKITPTSIAKGMGFVTDYFGEVLVKLREDSFASALRDLQLEKSLTRRDYVSVERLTSGLIKILHPNGAFTREELEEIVLFACEYRQRIHDQLVKMAPGEFRPKRISLVTPPPPS